MRKLTYTTFASKIKNVRLVCKRTDCEAVIEVPVARLYTADRNATLPDLRCPGCGKSHRFATNDNQDHLKLLGLAIQTAAAHAEDSDIEFVIHDDAPETK